MIYLNVYHVNYSPNGRVAFVGNRIILYYSVIIFRCRASLISIDEFPNKLYYRASIMINIRKDKVKNFILIL